MISDNIQVETYKFKAELQEFGRRGGGTIIQKTTHIILEDNKYSDLNGIRIFLDYTKMANSNTIEYTFADGLFGLRVLKSYEFK